MFRELPASDATFVLSRTVYLDPTFMSLDPDTLYYLNKVFLRR